MKTNIACNKSCLEDLADVAQLSIKPDIPGRFPLLVYCIKGSLKVLFKHFSSMLGFNPSNVQFVTLLNMFSIRVTILYKAKAFVFFLTRMMFTFCFVVWLFFFYSIKFVSVCVCDNREPLLIIWSYIYICLFMYYPNVYLYILHKILDVHFSIRHEEDRRSIPTDDDSWDSNPSKSNCQIFS